jgi:hypothetical protein
MTFFVKLSYTKINALNSGIIVEKMTKQNLDYGFNRSHVTSV